MTILRTSLFTLFVLVVSASAALAIIAVDWTGSTTSTATGNLGGVGVTMTNAGVSPYPVAILNYDLSTADYAPYQLAASQETMDYSFDRNWTATFGQPLSNVMLYCKFWRGPNNSNDPPVFEYRFDQPFTILAGMGNCTINGNTLEVPSTIFQDGILLFSGPVTSISVLSNNANSASRQGLTFGLEEDPVATESSTWDGVKSLYR